MISLFADAVTRKLAGYEPYIRLLKAFHGRRFPIDVTGAKGSLLDIVIARLHQESKDTLLVVVPGEQEVRQLSGDVAAFGVESVRFPGWHTAPYRTVGMNANVFGERVHVLSRILNEERLLVIASLRSLLWPVPPPSTIQERTQVIRAGEPLDPVCLAERLTSYGYNRVGRVSLRGEFALRGEVMDIFPAGEETAVRLVFDFEEVGEIRWFDPGTQTSVGQTKQVELTPLREVVWEEEQLERLSTSLHGIPELASEAPRIRDILENEGRFEGEELYYPLAFDRPASLIDYLSPTATVLFAEMEQLVSTADSLENDYAAAYREARRERSVPHPDRLLLSFDELERRRDARIRFHLFEPGADGAAARADFEYDPPRSFFGNVNFFKDELESLEEAGYDIFVFAESETQKTRLEHLLSDHDVHVLPASLSEGFTVPDLKLTVIQENEIFGRRKRRPQSVQRARSTAIDTFVELNPGDYVVHVNYGIGRFCGIRRMTAGGNERDYIQLEYAGEEYVYIPIEQVNLIQRYIGHGGENPRLDRLGGKSWEKRKSKVQKNVEDLAERLVRLYSRRKTSRGFAFPPDTEWQLDFEAAFPYAETEDQLRCIDEVKQDMEQPTPMDRLVCGDVGYGKTEVAMRAAFKAVSAGKQVAVLAPTTILAEQHYETFSERLERFPVRTEMLSRFVPRAEQRRVTEGLEKGRVDVVIGTHRLLQRDVSFKDLGLMVIDEEQRFGVKDKERLKELKTSVDSLTLTATPIPRTLHMSLLRIRDMSVLNTPPHNRRPIETYIEEFNEERVADAIRKEVNRGGQVYYLHNRVDTLEQVERFLRKLMPDVLIESAHGQMDATELEDVMHRFVHGGVQVLVSTTIIENGIDIPNVNTIVIDRADMYGISQLYQLRGRVGRSERLAYAYLFYPERRALSEVAMKRLQVISDYTELGSGFKIALKDLEVRGAGNLLGREQSGDILSVGFDMYLQLLDEAIRRLNEQENGDEPPEVYMELDYTGYVPDSYIAEPEEKMEVYKKIAAVQTEEELGSVHTELEDRFGPMPDEVYSLLSLAEIRIMCRRLHISSIRERKGAVEIEFAKVARISTDRIMKLIEASGGKVKLNPQKPNSILMDTGSVGLKEKSEFIRGKLSTLL